MLITMQTFLLQSFLPFWIYISDIGDGDIGDAVGDIGDEDIPIDARQTTGDSREYKCEDTKSSSSETPLLELLG